MTAVVTLHHYGRDSNSGREPASAASGLVRAVIERWNTPILSLIPQPDALMNHEQAPSHNHDIQDLEEFGSTDFATLLFFQTEKHRTTKKRKRSHKIDVASIIPPPHFIESPDSSRKPSSGIVELRPHKVLEILNPKFNTILQESHGYCQWLIPVSGNPPGSTKLSSGVLLHPSGEPTPDTPISHDSLGAPHQIKWSPLDLLLFWLWLRDIQTKSIFGPISLSVTSTGHLPISTPTRPLRSTLHYISIYHDAKLSLRLRTFIAPFDPSRILDKLPPESKLILANTFPEHPKTLSPSRPLKGATLLLLDHSNNGLLAS
ncbi:hypothetical protein FRC03_007332 [Tulasnella sp. 419]|nr:hypothetical protein FRC03_007332 [Tulasnella sp. 419]